MKLNLVITLFFNDKEGYLLELRYVVLWKREMDFNLYTYIEYNIINLDHLLCFILGTI